MRCLIGMFPPLVIFAMLTWSVLMPAELQAQNNLASFLISPHHNLSGAVECPFVTYQAWDGSMRTAWIQGESVVSVPFGNVFAPHAKGKLEYFSPEGDPLSAGFEEGKLIIMRKGAGAPEARNGVLAFRSWDGQSLYAKVLPPPREVNPPLSGEVPHQGSRFSLQNGEITDWQTNLVWKEGADADISYSDAQSWIRSLGSPWRQPTRAELKTLFMRGDGGGLKGNMPKTFPKMGGTAVWAEENDSSTAWYIGFIYANGYALNREKSRFCRVFAVRPRE